MREAPAFTPTASPRLRRSTSTWPPHRIDKPASELVRAESQTRDHALQTGPYPSDLSRQRTYGASDNGSSRTPSHHCLPDPDRLTVPIRPVRCQGCSHRRAHSHVSAAPSFTDQLRLTGSGVLSPPLNSTALRGAPSSSTIIPNVFTRRWATEPRRKLMPITRISGERANNTNKIYPEKTRQPMSSLGGEHRRRPGARSAGCSVSSGTAHLWPARWW